MNVFEAMATLGLDTSGFESGLSSASSELSSFGNLVKANVIGNLITDGLEKAASGIMDFAKQSISAGQAFDTSMSQVAATMGKTVDEICELRDFAMEMGAKTSFSAVQASDALNYMALAGYKVEESMEMLPNVLNLAAAGSMDLARASDMITDSQSALGLEFDETSVLVDQMAAASSNANASVEQLGDAILRVGGTAKSLNGGMITLSDGTQKAYSSTAELNQVLGLLANAGVKGAEGGTALRNIILSLTAPTDKAKDALDALGVSAVNQSGELRPMRDIFADLNTELSKMSDQKKTETLNKIFNKTDLKSVNALLGQNVDEWNNLALAIDDSKYAAEMMAKTQLDNLNGDMELFRSALEGVHIVFADMLTPDLRSWVQLGTEGLTTITDAFNNTAAAKGLVESLQEVKDFSADTFTSVSESFQAMEEAQTAAATGAGFESWAEMGNYVASLGDNLDGVAEAYYSLQEAQTAAAAGAGFESFEAMGSYVSDAQDKVEQLKGTFSTLSAVLDTGLSLEQFTSEAYDAKEVANEIFENLKGADEATQNATIKDLFKGAIENWTEFADLVENDDLSVILEDRMNSVQSAVSSGLDIYDAIDPEGLEEHLSRGEEGILSLYESINQIDTSQMKDGFSAVMEAVPELLNSFVSAIMEMVPQALELGGQAINALIEGIMTGLPALAESATEIMSNFGQYFSENGATLIENGLTMLTELSGSLRENAGVLIDGALGVLIDGALEMAVNMAKGFAEGIPAMIENIPTIVSNIAGIINDNAPKLLTAGVEILITLGKGLIQAIPTLIANIPQILKAMYDVFTAFNWMAMGSNIIKFIGDGVKSLATNLPNILKGIGETAKGFISGIDWLGAGTNIISSIGSGISSLLEAIPSLLKGIAETAVEFFKSVDWLQVGNDIINGLISGIVALGDTAAEAVKGIGTAILDGIKGLFGINSPSTVFAEIGENLMLGLQEGVESNSDSALEPVENLRDEMQSAFDGSPEFFASTMAEAAEAIKSAWDPVTGTFNGSWEEIAETYGGAPEFYEATFGDALASAQAAWEPAPSIFSGIWDAISAVFSAVQSVLGADFSAAWSAVQLVWSAATGYFANLWNTIQGVFAVVESVLSGDFSGAWNAIQGIFAGWGSYFQGLLAQVINIFAGIRDTFFNIGSNLVSGFLGGIQSSWNTLTGWVGEGIARLKAKFTSREGFDEHSPSKWAYGVMENVVAGAVNGWSENEGVLIDTAADTVSSVQNELSAARDWAKEIGSYVAVDLANGMEKESTKAQEAVEKAASNIYSGLSTWADRNTKYEALTLQDQLDMWTAILGQFQQESDQWWSAYDKVFDLQEKVAEEHTKAVQESYDSSVEAIEYAVKRMGLSTAAELSQYEELRDQYERGTEQWLAADEKVFDLRKKREKEAYDNLTDTVEKATKRQKLTLREQLDQWTAIMSRYAADSEYYAQAEEKVYDLREDIIEDYYSRVKSVNKGISDLEKDYQKELESRTKEIAGSYSLFGSVEEYEEIKGRDLTKNLRQQVQTIREFYADIDELASRGIFSESLIAELRDMGPSALNEIKAFMRMSEGELNQYAALYEEKQALANSIALSELADLRTETDAQIDELLTNIADLFDENAEIIGAVLPQGIAEGIRDNMDEALDAASELSKAMEQRLSDYLNGTPWIDETGTVRSFREKDYSPTMTVSAQAIPALPDLTASVTLNMPELELPSLPEMTLAVQVDDFALQDLRETIAEFPDTLHLTTVTTAYEEAFQQSGYSLDSLADGLYRSTIAGTNFEEVMTAIGVGLDELWNIMDMVSGMVGTMADAFERSMETTRNSLESVSEAAESTLKALQNLESISIPSVNNYGLEEYASIRRQIERGMDFSVAAIPYYNPHSGSDTSPSNKVRMQAPQQQPIIIRLENTLETGGRKFAQSQREFDITEQLRRGQNYLTLTTR